MHEMTKISSHPEFYTLFYLGWTPKDLIELGFQKNSVYNYHRKYQNTMKRKLYYFLVKGSIAPEVDPKFKF